MPVNTGLADVSNDLLLTAVVIYALAMLAYACDFAFGRKQARAASTAKAPALVAVGSSEAATVTAAPAAAGAGLSAPAEPSAPSGFTGAAAARRSPGGAAWDAG